MNGLCAFFHSCSMCSLFPLCLKGPISQTTCKVHFEINLKISKMKPKALTTPTLCVPKHNGNSLTVRKSLLNPHKEQQLRRLMDGISFRVTIEDHYVRNMLAVQNIAALSSSNSG